MSIVKYTTLPAYHFRVLRNMTITVLLLLLYACNPGSQEGMAGADRCDGHIMLQYRNMMAAAKDGTSQGKKIIAFYQDVPEPCRDTLTERALLDLFDIIYQEHTTASFILPFFKQVADEKSLDKNRRAQALLYTAGYYLYALQQPDSAIGYLQEANIMSQATNDTDNYKGYQSMMGEYMIRKGRLKEAAGYYLHVITLCEQQKDSAGIAANLGNYGSIFSAMKEYEKAAAIKTKAAAYFERRKEYNSLLIGYIGIGADYVNMNRPDSSRLYFNKALALIEKGARNPSAEFNIYINLAALAMSERAYDSARMYYVHAREILDVMQNPERDRLFLLASTPAFAMVKNMDKEIETIKKYLPAFFAVHDLPAAQDAAYALYYTYSLQQDYKKALPHFIVYDSLKNVLAQSENKQYITETEARYETQKKELKIQLQEREIRRKSVFSGLLLMVVLLTLLVSAFIVTRSRLNRSRKEADMQKQFTRRLLENTEEERERIARDLHDGISQDLLILKRQSATDQHLVHERIDAIIQEIRMISRDLHPEMLDKMGLKASVEHICRQLTDGNTFSITADISYSISLNRAIELQLFRMIQEALNNIMKYAAARAAKVTIRETDTHVITEVIDNGKGFDVAAAMNSKMSFGLLNLTERSRALKGRTEITSSAEGTLVKIEIPKQS